jgi:hypothetical protein
MGTATPNQVGPKPNPKREREGIQDSPSPAREEPGKKLPICALFRVSIVYMPPGQFLATFPSQWQAAPSSRQPSHRTRRGLRNRVQTRRIGQRDLKERASFLPRGAFPFLLTTPVPSHAHLTWRM